jgi:isoquinoline 1-oxidoreductase
MRRRPESLEPDRHELRETPPYRLDLSRRGFLGTIGAGFVVAVGSDSALGAPDAGPSISTRLSVGADGVVTVFSSKVEVGQGARTQLAQAVAEEMKLPLERVSVVLADTSIVPDDGGTFGSRTTGYTIPPVRQAAAAAREILEGLARDRFGISDGAPLDVRAGEIRDPKSGRTISYAELARDVESAFAAGVPSDVALTPVEKWDVLGRSARKPTSRDIVTGAHLYPSDIAREGMLYGAVLRPPSYGARLLAVDLDAARSLPGVVAVQDGEFVGCAAETSFDAGRAVEALAKTARWEESSHPSSQNLFRYLKENVDTSAEPRSSWSREKGFLDEAFANGARTLEASYEVSYIQHAPMEPRAACAEWSEGSVTVWTGTQVPSRVQGELRAAFDLPEGNVRVIVPDTGGGFGGKHTGEVAVEAARLARAAGRPVSLRYRREEEFTWAYFRPAALIEVKGALGADGAIRGFRFDCYNAGAAGLESPYELPASSERYIPCRAPLRQGSYRALAATANHFARESFLDELAHAAGRDPVSFRLEHLKDARLRDVLEKAVERFRFHERAKEHARGNGRRGVGVACGTEKGSYVATCVSVRIDSSRGKILLEEIVEAYECGKIQNPVNLRAQVEGGIIMGIGGALKEEVRFENGRILNPRFSMYQVPRTRDLVPMEILLLDRPDLPSVGAGETPLIALAPAIANAVFHATGIRIRTMPVKSDRLRA